MIGSPVKKVEKVEKKPTKPGMLTALLKQKKPSSGVDEAEDLLEKI